MPTRPIPAIFMDWSTLTGTGPQRRLRRRPARGHREAVTSARAMVPLAILATLATRVGLVTRVAQEVGEVVEMGRKQETRWISRQGSKWRERRTSS